MIGAGLAKLQASLIEQWRDRIRQQVPEGADVHDRQQGVGRQAGFEPVRQGDIALAHVGARMQVALHPTGETEERRRGE